MALMVSREDGSSGGGISVQQELDVDREEGESCYGLVLLRMSSLFMYKVLN